jgi:hypothetical protein
MFGVANALVSLFFDRRVYIIDGTGKFSVSGGSTARHGAAVDARGRSSSRRWWWALCRAATQTLVLAS